MRRFEKRTPAVSNFKVKKLNEMRVMKTIALFWLLVAFCMAHAVVAPAAEGKVYANPRFGFALVVPPGAVSLVEADNGDGITVRYRGGMELRAYGSHAPAVLSQDCKAIFEESKALFDEVTYARLDVNNGWFVLSGYQDGQIQYLKTFVGNGLACSVAMTYPREQLKQYDAFVRAVVASFEPGPLE